MTTAKTKKKSKSKGFGANRFVCDDKTTKFFWSRVDRIESKTKCWLYTGSVSAAGYGIIWLPKRKDGSRKSIGAHRYSWLLHSNKKRIPKGSLVTHVCNKSRACVNPAHLRLGSHRSNMNDMKFYQTHHVGSRHPRSKLTEADVVWMRNKYAEGGIRHREFAEKFNVSASCISFIISGKTWKQVGGKRTHTAWKVPSPLRKFTDKQAKEIRKRYKAGETSTALAKEFGCNVQTLIWIVNGVTYKDI